MIASELETPVDVLFSEFSEPVAAASIAQVHRAKLKDTGRELRSRFCGLESPGRSRRISMLLPDRLVGRDSGAAARRLRPNDVVAHFEATVVNELDLRIESAAAGEFAASTAKDEGFFVPQVEWSCHPARS